MLFFIIESADNCNCAKIYSYFGISSMDLHWITPFFISLLPFIIKYYLKVTKNYDFAHCIWSCFRFNFVMVYGAIINKTGIKISSKSKLDNLLFYTILEFFINYFMLLNNYIVFATYTCMKRFSIEAYNF